MNSYASKFIRIFFFFFIHSAALAQQSWEVGASFGGTGYMGSLNPDNPYKLTDVAWGVQLRRNINPRWCLKSNFLHGTIRAQDADSEDAYMRSRNLSFFSPLWETSIAMELNFFNYILGRNAQWFTPYLFTGIAGLYYNPKARLNNKVYDLRLYGTESNGAQFKPYSPYTLSIPYGIGFKLYIGSHWNLLGEIGYRLAFTNHLDDVNGNYADKSMIEDKELREVSMVLADPSRLLGKPIGTPGTQRGNHSKFNTYVFSGFSITYTFFSMQPCYFKKRKHR